MSETRLMKLLEGQSSIANKIFQFVPIQEAWDAQDIHRAALASEATTVSIHAIRRALGELSDAGAIREPAAGLFQRDAVIPKARKEPAMPTPAKQLKPGMDQATTGTLDVLASLSAEVVTLSNDFGARLKGLAKRIDDVALTVEAEREANSEAATKLLQLQTLLKGL